MQGTTFRLPGALRPLGALVLGLVVLAACDDDNGFSRGISSLGLDFVQAFNQEPNDTPFDAQDIDNFALTPLLEPFNP